MKKEWTGNKEVGNKSPTNGEIILEGRKREGRLVSYMCKKISSLKGCSADDLLKRCGQDENVPVDLNAILNKLKISALPLDFSRLKAELEREDPNIFQDRDILGALISNGENAAIFYREQDVINSHRYRFTIAHELAHACLTGNSNHVEVELRVSGAPVNELENEANRFAGELLIPEKQFYKIIKQLYLPSVHTLARVFDVSENVMKERIKCLRPSISISGYHY